MSMPPNTPSAGDTPPNQGGPPPGDTPSGGAPPPPGAPVYGGAPESGVPGPPYTPPPGQQQPYSPPPGQPPYTPPPGQQPPYGGGGGAPYGGPPGQQPPYGGGGPPYGGPPGGGPPYGGPPYGGGPQPPFDPSINQNDKLWAALSYVFGIVAIIVLILDDTKRRPFIKYHAVQALGLWVVIVVYEIVINIIWNIIIWGILFRTSFGLLGVFSCLSFILWILPWALALYFAYMAYQGRYFEIPVITDFLAQQKWLQKQTTT